MILFNSLILLFSLFVAPNIIIYHNFKKIDYSLVTLIGFVISFTIAWFLFLTLFILNISDKSLNLLSYIILIYTLFLIFKNRNINFKEDSSIIIIWLISLILSFPILIEAGQGFVKQDAVVAWNKWAMDLYLHKYETIGTAYPILFPAIWSLIYKAQQTQEIWWIAKLTLFVAPIYLTVILISLFRETKQIVFLLLLILVYPYIFSEDSITGLMDVPLTTFGFLSVTSLFAASFFQKRNSNLYIYCSLLLGGLASIIKPFGLVFIAFCVSYTFLTNLKFFKKKFNILIVGLSIIYPITFIIFYLQFDSTLFANEEHLRTWRRSDSGNFFLEFLRYQKLFFYKTPIFYVVFYYLTLLLIIFKIFKKNFDYKSIIFIILSGIFSLATIFIWLEIFSYSGRNSLYIQVFIVFISLIVFHSYSQKLNYQYFKINKYINSIYISGIVQIFLLVTFILGILIVKDSYVYDKAKINQTKLGRKNVVHFLDDDLKNKKECVKIFTDMQLIKYNYHLKNRFNSFEILKKGKTFREYIGKIECSDGAYIVLKWKNRKFERFKEIVNLIESGEIMPINLEKALVYYVPQK
jgi:hypothetical protein